MANLPLVILGMLWIIQSFKIVYVMRKNLMHLVFIHGYTLSYESKWFRAYNSIPQLSVQISSNI